MYFEVNYRISCHLKFLYKSNLNIYSNLFKYMVIISSFKSLFNFSFSNHFSTSHSLLIEFSRFFSIILIFNVFSFNCLIIRDIRELSKFLIAFFLCLTFYPSQIFCHLCFHDLFIQYPITILCFPFIRF